MASLPSLVLAQKQDCSLGETSCLSCSGSSKAHRYPLVPLDLFLQPALWFSLFLSLCPHIIFSVYICILVSPYKDSSHTGAGPTHMIRFNLNYLFKDHSLIQSHSGGLRIRISGCEGGGVGVQFSPQQQRTW